MTLGHAWLPQGTVYGTLLNFRREFDLWAPKMSEPPYQDAPRAPVLILMEKSPACLAAMLGTSAGRSSAGRESVEEMLAEVEATKATVSFS